MTAFVIVVTASDGTVSVHGTTENEVRAGILADQVEEADSATQADIYQVESMASLRKWVREQEA